ncbi:MAG: hypothetical protein U0J38_07455 [Bacteroidales bacterium]|nr:hypothetical protein [Bacteroidales bacterium]
MKKLIVTIICVLFASTSFAQMVGANSISKQSTPKTTLGVKKHEFSIHGGVGKHEYDGEFVQVFEYTFAGILKYKYKPSEKYDIRFLAETAFTEYVIPLLVGVNYERRLNNNWSVFADLGTGISIPLTPSISYYAYESDTEFKNFGIGFAFSPEIGFIHKNFMFSFKYLYSFNRCLLNTKNDGSWGENPYESSITSAYNSQYLLFTLGYRF